MKLLKTIFNRLTKPHLSNQNGFLKWFKKLNSNAKNEKIQMIAATFSPKRVTDQLKGPKFAPELSPVGIQQTVQTNYTYFEIAIIAFGFKCI